MRKRVIILALTALMLLSMVGCSRNNHGALKALDNKHANEVRNDLKTFKSGDIAEITQCVFGTTSDAGSEENTSTGIIADLFSNAEIAVAEADKSTITYTIVTRDISDFFQANAEELLTITTSEELGQAILEYAQTAPEKEYTVSLAYTTSDSGIDVAYDDPDFINAMTGGLLDAYAALYEEYLAEGE